MAAILASNAASSILCSILLGSDFPIVRFLSLFFFEMSIAKNLTSFLASLLDDMEVWLFDFELNWDTEMQFAEMKGESVLRA